MFMITPSFWLCCITWSYNKTISYSLSKAEDFLNFATFKAQRPLLSKPPYRPCPTPQPRSLWPSHRDLSDCVASLAPRTMVHAFGDGLITFALQTAGRPALSSYSQKWLLSRKPTFYYIKMGNAL